MAKQVTQDVDGLRCPYCNAVQPDAFNWAYKPSLKQHDCDTCSKTFTFQVEMVWTWEITPLTSPLGRVQGAFHIKTRASLLCGHPRTLFSPDEQKTILQHKDLTWIQGREGTWGLAENVQSPCYFLTTSYTTAEVLKTLRDPLEKTWNQFCVSRNTPTAHRSLSQLQTLLNLGGLVRLKDLPEYDDYAMDTFGAYVQQGVILFTSGCLRKVYDTWEIF